MSRLHVHANALGHEVDVVVLAAGRGSRLGALTAETPKPLLEVAGRPILFRLLDGLADLQVRRAAVVVGYQSEKVIAAVAKYAESSALEIACLPQLWPNAEGAIRSGLEWVRARRTVVLCADELLQPSVLHALIEAPDAGAFMTRIVGDNPTLPRLCIRGARIAGVSADVNAPIMTYNFCLTTDLLREWVIRLDSEGQSMVHVVDQVVGEGIYAVDDAGSVGVNHPEDLLTATDRLRMWGLQ